MSNHKDDHAHHNNDRYCSKAGKQSKDDKYGTEEFCKYSQSQRNGSPKAHKIIEVIFQFAEMNEFIIAVAGYQNAKG